LSNNGGKRIFRWHVNGKITVNGKPIKDDEFIFERPKTTFEESIDESVIAFEKHRENLLVVLRRAHESGANTGPFDADRAWRRLVTTAHVYLWFTRIKREKLPVAVCRDRLGKIADALGEARRLINEADQDEVLDYLYFAWRDQTIGEFAKCDAGPEGEIVILPDLFDEAVAALSALEVAACKARDDSAPRKWRPKGSVMSPQVIRMLARRYEASTGLKLNKLTDKQFVEFVGAFLGAVGAKVSKNYALEAIKYALRLKRKAERHLGE
jgi:hypothetical protein